MNHEKLVNKLSYEDLNFIGVNPLYELAKKHDKTITKEFVSNLLKSQSTQQQTTKMVKKKEYKPIYSEDYYGPFGDNGGKWVGHVFYPQIWR